MHHPRARAGHSRQCHFNEHGHFESGDQEPQWPSPVHSRIPQTSERLDLQRALISESESRQLHLAVQGQKEDDHAASQGF